MDVRQELLRLIQTTAFPEVERLRQELEERPDGLVVSDLSVSCSALRSSLEKRLKRLRMLRSDHAADLSKAMTALLRELKKGGACYLCGFEYPPNIIYSLYLAEDGPRILGCLRSFDERKTDDEAWERLWGSPPEPS